MSGRHDLDEFGRVRRPTSTTSTSSDQRDSVRSVSSNRDLDDRNYRESDRDYGGGHRSHDRSNSSGHRYDTTRRERSRSPSPSLSSSSSSTRRDYNNGGSSYRSRESNSIGVGVGVSVGAGIAAHTHYAPQVMAPTTTTATNTTTDAASSGMIISQVPRKQRELYVGNLAVGYATDVHVRELFNRALAALLPNPLANPPVLGCKMNGEGKFAFVELRTEDLATAGLFLNQFTFFGRRIKVGRPKGYVEPAPVPTSAAPTPTGGEAPTTTTTTSGSGSAAAATTTITSAATLAMAAAPPQHMAGYTW